MVPHLFENTDPPRPKDMNWLPQLEPWVNNKGRVEFWMFEHLLIKFFFVSSKISILFKIFFSSKISIFHQNFDFLSKFRFFIKISIFTQNLDTSSKHRLFIRISIFYSFFDIKKFAEKCDFIFDQNFDFG